ncbi:hypothetical protein, partial [Oceanithermus sp.]
WFAEEGWPPLHVPYTEREGKDAHTHYPSPEWYLTASSIPDIPDSLTGNNVLEVSSFHRLRIDQGKALLADKDKRRDKKRTTIVSTTP